MSRRWKSTGGAAKSDSINNINVNTIVADTLTLKDYYYGNFEILGNIRASGSIEIESNLIANYVGAETLLANSSLKVLRNATVYGNSAVKNDQYIYNRGIFGNIEGSGNVLTLMSNDSEGGRFFISQAQISNLLEGVANEYFIGKYGINSNDPQAALDIFSGLSKVLDVKSNNEINYNILARNVNNTGVVLYTDNASSSIRFFNETEIDGVDPDASVEYIQGGDLYIDTSNNTIIHSKVTISNRDEEDHIMNETLVVYDQSYSEPYLYDVFEQENILGGEAASFVSYDNSSITMINLITPNHKGLVISGGANPNDLSKPYSSLGTIDVNKKHVPSITIQGSDNHLFFKNVVGINTTNPKSGDRALDINGKIFLRNSEVSLVTRADYEILNYVISERSPNYSIALGTPYTLEGDVDTIGEDEIVRNYQQKIIYSSDYGKTWIESNFNNTDIGFIQHNFRGAYAYDADFIMVGADDGLLYFSNDGGDTWYGISNIPSTFNVISIHIQDMASGPFVRRVILISDNSLFWFNLPNNIYTLTAGFNSQTNGYDIFALANGLISNKAHGTNSYLYLTGEAAGFHRIYKYNIISTISSTPAIIYESTNVRKYNDIFILDDDNVVAVGNSIITYTNDGGNSWYDNVYNVNTDVHQYLDNVILNNVFLYDTTTALAVGYKGESSVILYTVQGYEEWQTLPANLLFDAGAPPSILSSSTISNVFIPNLDNIQFTNILTSYDFDNDVRGSSSIFNCYLPSIFNEENNFVLNASGGIMVEGNTEISKNLLVKGTSVMQDILIPGEATINSLIITGTVSAEELTVAGNTYYTDITITGGATMKDIDVSGNATIGSLFVLDAATISDLNITGTINALDIYVTDTLYSRTLDCVDASINSLVVYSDFTAATIDITDTAHIDTVDCNDVIVTGIVTAANLDVDLTASINDLIVSNETVLNSVYAENVIIQRLITEQDASLNQLEVYNNTWLNNVYVSDTVHTNKYISTGLSTANTLVVESDSSLNHVLATDVFVNNLIAMDTIDSNDLNVLNQATINTLTVEGNTLLNILDVTGNSTLSDTSIVGNTVISGNLEVYTDSSLNILNVSGLSTLSDVSANKLKIYGNVVVDDTTNLNKLNVSGISNLHDTNVVGLISSNFIDNSELISTTDFISTGVSEHEKMVVYADASLNTVFSNQGTFTEMYVNNIAGIESMVVYSLADIHTLNVNGVSTLGNTNIVGNLTNSNTITTSKLYTDSSATIFNLVVPNDSLFNKTKTNGLAILSDASINNTVANKITVLDLNASSAYITNTIDTHDVNVRNNITITGDMTTNGIGYIEDLVVGGLTDTANLTVNDTTNTNMLNVSNTATIYKSLLSDMSASLGFIVDGSANQFFVVNASVTDISINGNLLANNNINVLKTATIKDTIVSGNATLSKAYVSDASINNLFVYGIATFDASINTPAITAKNGFITDLSANTLFSNTHISAYDLSVNRNVTVANNMNVIGNIQANNIQLNNANITSVINVSDIKASNIESGYADIVLLDSATITAGSLDVIGIATTDVISANIAEIQEMYVSNDTFINNLYTVGNLVAGGDSEFGNLEATNGTITTLSSTSATIGTVNATTATLDSGSVTNGFIVKDLLVTGNAIMQSVYYPFNIITNSFTILNDLSINNILVTGNTRLQNVDISGSILASNDINAANLFISGNTSTGNISATNGSIITLTAPTINSTTITTTDATITTGSITTLNATNINATGNAVISGNTSVTGNVSGSNLAITNNVTAANVTLTGNVSADKITTTFGTIADLTAPIITSTTINVTTANVGTEFVTALTAGSLAVTGAASVTGNISGNNLALTGNVSTNRITGNYLGLSNGLEAQGDASFNNVYIGGTLTYNAIVSSETTLQGNTDVQNITVTGNAILANVSSTSITTGTLTTNGTSTFNGPTNFVNDVSTNKLFTAFDNAIFRNNITVVKDVSMNGNLYVSGTNTTGGVSRYLSDVSVNGILYATNVSSLSSQPLRFNVDSSFGQVFVSGNLISNSNAIVRDISLNGNLVSQGTITQRGALNVQGDTSLNALIVNSTSRFNQLATFMDDISLNKDLNVYGNTTLHNQITFTGDTSANQLFVSGNLISNSNAIIRDISLNGNLVSQGTITQRGALNVQGDTSLNALIVNSTSRYNQLASFIGDVSMNKDLNVFGNTRLNQRFGVIGDTSLNKLFVNQAAVFSDTLTSTGTINVPTINATTIVNANTLNMIKDASFNGNLTLRNGAYYGQPFYQFKNTAQMVVFPSINMAAYALNSYVTITFWAQLSSSFNVNFEPLLKLNGLNFIESFGTNWIISNSSPTRTFGYSLNQFQLYTFVVPISTSTTTSAQYKVYINTDQKSAFTPNTSFLTNTNNVFSFGPLNTTHLNCDLRIKDFRVYNTELSVQHITDLYNDTFTSTANLVFRDTAMPFNNQIAYAYTNLYVSSDTHLNQNLNVIGDSSLNRNLVVAGNTITNRLVSIQDASFNVGITVGGTSNFNNRMNVNDLSTNTMFVSGESKFNNRMIALNDVSFNKQMFVLGKSIFGNDVDVKGDISLNNIYVNGTAYLKNVSMEVSMAGDANFSGGLFVKESGIIEENFTIQGDTSLNTLFVSSQSRFNELSIFNNDASMNRNLSIGGNVITRQSQTVNADLSANTLFITGNSTLNRNALIIGDVSLNSRLWVNGNTIIAGKSVFDDVSLNRLVVNNVSVFQRNMIAEDISLNNNLNVGGNTTISKNAIILGDLSLNNMLTIGGNTRINSNIVVIGDSSLNNGLNVGGNTVLKQRLNVLESAIFSRDVVVGDNKQYYKFNSGTSTITFTSLNLTAYALNSYVTVSFWIFIGANWNAVNSDNAAILRSTNNSRNILQWLDNKVSFGNSTNGFELSRGRFHFVTLLMPVSTSATLATANTIVYVNDTLRNTFSLNSKMIENILTTFSIGPLGTASSTELIVRDFRVYNTALPYNTIYTLYNGENSTTGLLIYYPLNSTNTVGTTTFNTVSATNDGTLSNISNTYVFSNTTEMVSDAIVRGNTTVGNNLLVGGTISSTGTTALNTVTVQNTLGVTNVATFGNTMSVSGNTTLGQRLNVFGDASFNGSLLLRGNTVTGLGLLAFGDASLNGNLTVIEHTILRKTLNVSGNTTIDGNVSIVGNTVLGNRIIGMGDISLNGLLTVGNDTTLRSKLNVFGDVSFNQNTIIFGNTQMRGRLDISGNLRFDGSLNTLGNAAIQKQLVVVGDASFNSNVFTNGNTSLRGNLTMLGDLSLNGNAFINKNTRILGSLVTTGDVSFNNKLFVSQESYFDKKLIVNGDLSLNGVFLQAGVVGYDSINVKQDLSVNNIIIAGGNVEFKNNLAVTNNTTVNQNLFVNNQANLYKNAFIWGDMSLNGNADIFGNAVLRRRFTAIGDASFNNVYIGGDISLNKTLFVNGILSTFGNINIKGNSVVDNDVLAKGNVVADQNCVIKGNTRTDFLSVVYDASFRNIYLTGGLNVGQQLTSTSSITTLSDLSANGTLFANGNARLNSGLTVVGNTNVSNISISGNLLVKGQNLFTTENTWSGKNNFNDMSLNNLWIQNEIKTPTTINNYLNLLGGTVVETAGTVDESNRTNTYMRFGPTATVNDWTYLRQIGTADANKLAWDFHNDGNDCRMVYRSVQSSSNPDGAATTCFEIDNGSFAIGGASINHTNGGIFMPNTDNLSKIVLKNEANNDYQNHQIGVSSNTLVLNVPSSSGLFAFKYGAGPTTSLNYATIGSTGIDIKSGGLLLNGTDIFARNNIWTGQNTFNGNLVSNTKTITNIQLSYLSDLSMSLLSHFDMRPVYGTLLASSNNWSGTNSFSAVTTFTGNLSVNSITVTPTQLSRLNGVTSNIQTQLDAKTTLSAIQANANSWSSTNAFSAVTTFNGNVSFGSSVGITSNLTIDGETKIKKVLSIVPSTVGSTPNVHLVLRNTGDTADKCIIQQDTNGINYVFPNTTNSVVKHFANTTKVYEINNGSIGLNGATITHTTGGIFLPNTDHLRKIVLLGTNNNDFQNHSLGVLSGVYTFNVPSSTQSYAFNYGTGTSVSASYATIGSTGLNVVTGNLLLGGTNLFERANAWSGTNSFSSTLTLTGNLVVSGVTLTPTVISYLNGTTSNIQSQIDSKTTLAIVQSTSNTFTGTNTFNTNNVTISKSLIIGGNQPNIADGGIYFPRTEINRKIVLWADANNDYQVHSIGIQSYSTQFMVINIDCGYEFSAGLSASTKKDYVRIDNNGVNIKTGNLLLNGTNLFARENTWTAKNVFPTITLNGGQQYQWYNDTSNLIDNIYLKLGPSTSSTDYCTIRQIGSANTFKLAFDFGDDANDCRVVFRNSNQNGGVNNEPDLGFTGPCFEIDNGSIGVGGAIIEHRLGGIFMGTQSFSRKIVMRQAASGGNATQFNGFGVLDGGSGGLTNVYYVPNAASFHSFKYATGAGTDAHIMDMASGGVILSVPLRIGDYVYGTPSKSILFDQALSNRKIILWPLDDNEFQNFSIGVQTSTTQFMVPNTDCGYTFSVATSGNAKADYARIDNTGINITAGGLLLNGTNLFARENTWTAKNVFPTITLNGGQQIAHPLDNNPAEGLLNNVYLKLGASITNDDYCIIRQIGSADIFKLAFDFADSENDCRVVFRNIWNGNGAVNNLAGFGFTGPCFEIDNGSIGVGGGIIEHRSGGIFMGTQPFTRKIVMLQGVGDTTRFNGFGAIDYGNYNKSNLYYVPTSSSAHSFRYGTGLNTDATIMDMYSYQVNCNVKMYVPSIIFPQSITNRKIVLWDGYGETETSLYGIGVQNSTTQFIVPDTTAGYEFSAGTTNYVRIDNTGINIKTGTLSFNGTNIFTRQNDWSGPNNFGYISTTRMYSDQSNHNNRKIVLYQGIDNDFENYSIGIKNIEGYGWCTTFIVWDSHSGYMFSGSTSATTAEHFVSIRRSGLNIITGGLLLNGTNIFDCENNWTAKNTFSTITLNGGRQYLHPYSAINPADNVYLKLGGSTSNADYFVLRQIGLNEEFKLAFDFGDDGNDCRVVFRNLTWPTGGGVYNTCFEIFDQSIGIGGGEVRHTSGGLFFNTNMFTRKIVMREFNNNATQFNGFGVGDLGSSNVANLYYVPNSVSAHSFRYATGAGTDATIMNMYAAYVSINVRTYLPGLVIFSGSTPPYTPPLDTIMLKNDVTNRKIILYPVQDNEFQNFSIGVQAFTMQFMVNSHVDKYVFSAALSNVSKIDYAVFTNNEITFASRVNAPSFNATSDRRLKTNIKPFESQLFKIKSLSPVSFTWKETGNHDFGFLAQEVFSTYPAMRYIPEKSDGSSLDNPVDASGNPVYLAMDYSKLTTCLWKGLQESVEIIETQQTKIETQQTKIEKLETIVENQQSEIDELKRKLDKIMKMLNCE